MAPGNRRRTTAAVAGRITGTGHPASLSASPFTMKPLGAFAIPAVLPTLAGAASPLPRIETQEHDLAYQGYFEDDDRITVESWYLRGKLNLDSGTSVRYQYLYDAISGASPTGALPGGVQPFLSEMKDERIGILGAVAQQIGDHRVEVELARSREDDYLSHSIALSDRWELNEKNTAITLGVSYTDDSVDVRGLENQEKTSADVFAGVSQILDKNTVVSANLTLGTTNGYLNDPYKSIQRTDILSLPDGMGGSIDIPVVNTYSENRPDSRFRQVLALQGMRYFEAPGGALDTSLRLSNDDYGVFAQTLQIEWRQEVSERWELAPFLRYHRQNAADFFHNTLDGVPIGNPPDYPGGSAPNYSSDYRLSSLETIGLGLRATFKVNDAVSAYAAYERYQMRGSGDDRAPDPAYPDADIWTAGLRAAF